MSDVPELDRLLDERANVKKNKQWEWRDRLHRRAFGCMLLCVLTFFPLVFLFGDVGAFICGGVMLFCLAPILAAAVFEVLAECFKDPPPRDPTKRYHYK
jgi:hypothetical protein